MAFEDLDGAQCAELAGTMTGLARDLGNALTAARDMRDRAEAAASRGYRPDDAEYLAAKDEVLRAVLARLSAQAVAPAARASEDVTVPRRWWDALRSELERRAQAAGDADSVFGIPASAKRRIKSWDQPARYTLARMDALENRMTLEAALAKRGL